MALDKNVSPDADTTLFFTRGSVGAVDGSIELPAGKIVEFLVGFANKVNIILNKIQDFLKVNLEMAIFTFDLENKISGFVRLKTWVLKPRFENPDS